MKILKRSFKLAVIFVVWVGLTYLFAWFTYMAPDGGPDGSMLEAVSGILSIVCLIGVPILGYIWFTGEDSS